MSFIKSFLFLVLAAHGVNATNETLSDKIEEQSDHYITSTERSTTLKDELERVDSISENTEETTLDTILIASNETTIDTRQTSWSSEEENTEDTVQIESKEHNISTAVNVNSTDSLKSTISQTTTTDDTSSFIEVEEQIARQALNEDIEDNSQINESQISELSRNGTAINESNETPESTNDDDTVIDTDIGVTRSDSTDLLDSAEDKSVDVEAVEESIETSTFTTKEYFVELFNSESDDTITKSPNSRRMLNEPRLGMDFKIRAESITPTPQAVPSTHNENLGLQLLSNNIGARTRFAAEANTFKPILLSVPTLTLPPPLDNLSQPSQFNHAHSYFNGPNPLGRGFVTNQDRYANTATEVPLFRFWSRQPTKPSLLQQIQPYTYPSAYIPTRPPMVYHHNTVQDNIIEKLQQATRALRLDLAKRYAEWYRSKWNSVVNNIHNQYIGRF